MADDGGGFFFGEDFLFDDFVVEFAAGHVFHDDVDVGFGFEEVGHGDDVGVLGGFGHDVDFIIKKEFLKKGGLRFFTHCF